MTQESLKMALEFIERVNKDGWILADFEPQMYATITAIKEALREHAMREVQRLGQEIEQEPVALEAVYETIIKWDEGGGKRSRRELARRIVALYTTPPQRTWVDLTESDRRLINFQWQDGSGTATEIIDLVEAKLKDKNDVAQKTNS